MGLEPAYKVHKIPGRRKLPRLQSKNRTLRRGLRRNHLSYSIHTLPILKPYLYYAAAIYPV